jgi:outer membrane protein assembly factor BamE (lipoprotein component of BamABCDE complex)
MKKYIKYSPLIIFGFLVLSYLIVLYNIHWSKHAMKKKQNLENAKKINIGMSNYEVLKIMGKPNFIANHKNYFYYSYELQDESSHGCQINFDSTSKVRAIYFPFNCVDSFNYKLIY